MQLLICKNAETTYRPKHVLQWESPHDRDHSTPLEIFIGGGALYPLLYGGGRSTPSIYRGGGRSTPLFQSHAVFDCFYNCK